MAAAGTAIALACSSTPAQANGLTFTNSTTANGLGNNSVNGVYASGSTIYAATAGGLSISQLPSPNPVPAPLPVLSALAASAAAAACAAKASGCITRLNA